MKRYNINLKLFLQSFTKRKTPVRFAFSPLPDVRRYIFLFDKVVIVCKRKNYNYELKEIIELQYYKMSDDPTNNRDMKKVETLRVYSRVALREMIGGERKKKKLCDFYLH